MLGNAFVEQITIIPLMIREGAVNDESSFVNCSNAHWATFLLAFGDADTAIGITVEAASAQSTASGTIPFLYRLSGAVSAGSDTWGAITSCDSSGFSLTAATDTGKLALISVNPADLPDGQNYVHVRTPQHRTTAQPLLLCVALLRNRYSQQIHLSTT